MGSNPSRQPQKKQSRPAHHRAASFVGWLKTRADPPNLTS
jgi:hypothetical protein